MKFLIIIFLCFTYILGKSQNIDSLCRLAKSESVRVISVSYNSKQEILKDVGRGIVLHGEYLATCYHLISPEDTTFKFKYAFIPVNERLENGLVKFDSIFLTRNFKAKKNQYNFSSHIYNPADNSTDFVVLKLIKKYPKCQYNFSTRSIKYWDKVYSYGNVVKNDTVHSGFQEGIFIYLLNKKEWGTANYYSYLSTYTFGFSGTPLYNSKGDILAMVQSSSPEVPMELLKYLYINRKISLNIYQLIIDSYKKGHSIEFAIDYNYLKERYLKGYL